MKEIGTGASLANAFVFIAKNLVAVRQVQVGNG